MKSVKMPININNKILIVDDNISNLTLLGNILRENKYSVLVAKNGKATLNIIKSQKPDLILLDIMMPEMDGFEVCQQIKKDQTTSDIPIIFISAKNDTDSIVKGFNVGGQDYITKPYIKDELLARIRNLLTIEQNKKALRAIIKTKDKFFSIIAHDLKSPISNIISFSEKLTTKIEKRKFAKALQFAEYIQISAVSQYKLLENLLEWSQIQTGNLHPVFSCSNLVDILDEVVELYRLPIYQKQIELENTLSGNLATQADFRMISTIFRNLISNAVKYTPEFGKIIIEAQKTNNQIIISITNTSSGINPNNITAFLNKEISSNHLNNPGNQEHNTGTGLGLVICKELIKLNNGKIESLSTPPDKITFRICLPKK